jgi:microcystin-dependent protein
MTTQNRGYDDQGGQESVKLSINQMPEHSHKVRNIRISATRGGANKVEPWDSSGRDQVSNNGVAKSGNGEAHENMPPYITLYLCKRR